MKKNIALVVISLLLLCSLLMNVGFIKVISDDREIAKYKTLHCPVQMAAITKLQDKCLIMMEATYVDSLKNAYAE